MTWVRLDQDMAAHPKVAPLSDGAFRAFVYGLCYCNHYLTDGFIPERIAHTFVAAGAKGKRVAGEPEPLFVVQCGDSPTPAQLKDIAAWAKTIDIASLPIQTRISGVRVEAKRL